MRVIPGLKRLIGFITHRRTIAFWFVAAIALPAPWLVPGCASRMATVNKNFYENCRVLNVHDGDTMTVNCQGEKVKVRLYCIDAPELGQEPWGRAARDYLASTAGASVSIVAKGTDRYRRTIGVVSPVADPTTTLNLSLVDAGRAVVYEKYCNDIQYVNAQRTARSSRVGVWRVASGLHQKPWEFRAAGNRD